VTGTLRLRQVCLVAADLEREAQLFKDLLGLEECYRDPNVAHYGLENVLFPVGTDFIEIVSPTRPGTAAGRFLERHHGRHGYMIIMDCEDPRQRQQHCERLGVRTANTIEHTGYLGVQLHPKDTGGAMLEFNRTRDGDDPSGAYGPAGENWQRAIRRDVAQRLLAAEIECSDVAALARHWSGILERPVHMQTEGRAKISLDSGAIEFRSADISQAVMAGIVLEVTSSHRVMEKAASLGCIAADGALWVSGVRIRLSEGA
jgi:hypothetical protein